MRFTRTKICFYDLVVVFYDFFKFVIAPLFVDLLTFVVVLNRVILKYPNL